MGEKSFLIDTTKCIGCGSCTLACKNINKLQPSEYKYAGSPELSSEDWIVPVKTYGQETVAYDFSFITKMCYHCTDADCVKVCPAHAMKKQNDFIVIKSENCIGCGSCVKACVYGAVHLGKNVKEQKITAKKCDACLSSLNNNPICVSVCPTHAIKFDYRLKLIKEANKRIKEMKKLNLSAQVYGLFEFNGLNVLTIVKSDYEKNIIKQKPQISNFTKLVERSEIYKIINFFIPSLKSGKNYLYKILKSIV